MYCAFDLVAMPSDIRHHQKLCAKHAMCHDNLKKNAKFRIKICMRMIKIHYKFR